MAWPINIEEYGLNNGRHIKEDNTTVNLADIISKQFTGETMINGKTAGTSFGVDYVVATEKPELAAKWDHGIDLQTLKHTLTNGAYVKVSDNEVTLEIGTGVNPNAFGFIQSIKKNRYQPGIPGYLKFTASFPSLEESNGNYEIAAGTLSTENGYALVQRRIGNAIEYKFLVRKNSVNSYYGLNGDDISHLNLSNLNIFRLEYGFLGIDSTRLWVSDQSAGKWLLVHKQIYVGETTSVLSPNLPVGAYVLNQGNTLDIKFKNGSLQLGVINGGSGIDPSSRENNYGRTYTQGVATKATVFAFRNPETVSMYNSLNSSGTTTTRTFLNSIASKLLEVKATVISTKPSRIELFIANISDITSGTFTPVEANKSVLDVSVNAVVNLTNAKRLNTFLLSKEDRFDKDITQEYLLYPGQVAIFVITTTASTDVDAFISYSDLF